MDLARVELLEAYALRRLMTMAAKAHVKSGRERLWSLFVV